jgi:hypothetical protein
LEKMGLSSLNLALLSAGILGMALGLVPIEAIDSFARKWVLVLLLYVLYQLCSWTFGEIYSVEIFGAVASVLLLYTFAVHLDLSAWTGRQLLFLGRYSLLGYLTQIALIRAIVNVAGGKPEHWAGVIVTGALTTVLLFLVVHLVDSLRRRSWPVDAIYKGVFA